MRSQAELEHVAPNAAGHAHRLVMRQAGIQGVVRRGKGTTRRNPDVQPSDDLVNREFTVDGPDRLWVADIERHEAFLNLAVVKGHRFQFVAADW